MIYFNDPGRDLFFVRSRVVRRQLLADEDTLHEPRDQLPEDLTLEFESGFESGNLMKVDKISIFEYELTLRPDLYTNKHTQWYFFRVRNVRVGKTYRFTITNLAKSSSLYNSGMQPVFYSYMDAKLNKIGWTRKGENIRYYKNNRIHNGKNMYSLTWTSKFDYDDDTCYFAHCYPYTYTDLQNYLLNLANDPVKSRFCKQRVLCRTIAGNLVYILTITSAPKSYDVSQMKKAVILTARVHPGETNSSWMMKGFLDYLTSDSADAKLLRETFVFKIVPMLNPDGVIVGNYRCSLSGRDLNRNYKSSLKDSFPSIWHTKMMIKRLHAEREVVLYCDLHGHSRKSNIFIYGCENKGNPYKKLHERVFPLMLSKNACENFSFKSCKYKVQKSKEGTGRVVVWYMGVMNSYTMEATFGGTTLEGKHKDTHLRTRDLEKIGFDFCDTILDYCDPDKSKHEACILELNEDYKQRIERKRRGVLCSDSDTSGSDSSCDNELPVHLLSSISKIDKKKKLKTRNQRNKTYSSKPHSEANHVSSADVRKTSIKTEISKASRYNIPSKYKEQKITNTNRTRNEDKKMARFAKKLPTLSIKYLDPNLLTVIYNRRVNQLKNGNLQTSNSFMKNDVYVVSQPTITSAPVKELSFNYTKFSNEKPNSNSDSELTTNFLQNRIHHFTAQHQYQILRKTALKKQIFAGQQRFLAQYSDGDSEDTFKTFQENQKPHTLSNQHFGDQSNQKEDQMKNVEERRHIFTRKTSNPERPEVQPLTHHLNLSHPIEAKGFSLLKDLPNSDLTEDSHLKLQ